MSWDLSNQEAQVTTTKNVPYRWVIEELLWFLRGETNICSLLEKSVHIWSSDGLRRNLETVVQSGLLLQDDVDKARSEADDAKKILVHGEESFEERRKQHDKLMQRPNDIIKIYEKKILTDEDFAQRAGDLGPIYGAQWRGTNGVEFGDQVAELEEKLANKSLSRRKLVTAWNPAQLDEMALPPCHYLWQVHIKPESNKLDLSWTQRSCDAILGVPFNIASYALLATLLAETHGYKRGKLTGKFGDYHIYLPHIPAAKEQLQRTPLKQPVLEIINKKDSITEYTADDIRLVGGPNHRFKYKNLGRLENPTPMYGGLF